MATTETKLAQNRVYAKHLGWKPTDLGATDFNTLLVTLIAAQQQIFGVDVDGVAGPNTYRALLANRQAQLLADFGAATGDDKLRIAGQIAVCEAKRAWMTDIIDLPPKTSPDYARCQQWIDDTIRTSAGIQWDWEPPYQGGFKWCGAATARWWRAARLLLQVAHKFFASTYRLDRYARYGAIDNTTIGKNAKPPQGPYRKIIELNEKSRPTDAAFGIGDPPRAGDIVMIGPAQIPDPKGGPPTPTSDPYGVHICLVESYSVSTGMFTTLEGNGTGLDPFGNRQHGVVRAERPVGSQNPFAYHVRRLLRPSLQDLA